MLVRSTWQPASPPPIKRKDVDEEEEGEERKEKDDGDLFINKLVDLLDWFAQQVRRERLKLHRQLSPVLQVGRSLFFEEKKLFEICSLVHRIVDRFALITFGR